jgi:hypothetical protein
MSWHHRAGLPLILIRDDWTTTGSVDLSEEARHLAYVAAAPTRRDRPLLVVR